MNASPREAQIEMELRRRNAECLRRWRVRAGCPQAFAAPDAYSSVRRAYLEQWYARRVFLARAWLARSVFHYRQAN